MFRFIYYPQWNYRKIERELMRMEANGYRLRRICFYWFFFFEECKPRDNVQYIFTYDFLKEYRMAKFNHKLRSLWQANQISGGTTFWCSIYRITQADADLSEIIAFRQKNLVRVFVQKILMALIVSLISFGALILSSEDIALFGNKSSLLFVMGVIGVLFIFYYSFGIVALYKSRHEKSSSIGDNSAS